MTEPEKEKLRQIISRTDKSGNEKLDLLVEFFESLERVSVDAVVIGLPPLKEMEDEILEALENLDVIIHADKPIIGNRFATASAIYKVFKNKIDQ